MPVTAKLSRRFYETLGDEVVNELVALLNTVDTESRDRITELNESNWRRIEAKFDAMNARFESKSAAFEARMDAKFAAFEARMDARFDAFQAQMDARFDAFRAEIDAKFASMDVKFEGLRVEMHAFKAELIKWMFLFWIGTVASLGGLMYVLDGR